MQQEQSVMIIFYIACPESELGIVSNSTMSCDLLSSSNGGSIAIANGIGCFNNTTVGSVAIYRCVNGYFIVGNSQRHCQSNGSWTDNVPICTS